MPVVERNLRAMGYAVSVDDALVDEVGEHFRALAKREGKPLKKKEVWSISHESSAAAGCARR